MDPDAFRLSKEVYKPQPAVTEQKIPTESHRQREQSASTRFLAGPVPLAWIRQYIRDPADRLLLVLRAHFDMHGKRSLRLTKQIETDAGLYNRKAVYRALGKLEASAAIRVARRPGAKPLVYAVWDKHHAAEQ